MSQTEFFFSLTPDRVLHAVEKSGLEPTGRCLTLNSFENRVYDVELEPKGDEDTRARRVFKFYRPGRWSEQQILEEHQFLKDLSAEEIPAVAPMAFPDGKTLARDPESGIYYAFFPRVGGRAPDELPDEQLLSIGRLLARMHAVGARSAAAHRVRLTPTTYGIENLEFLLETNAVPVELRSRYESTVREICRLGAKHFEGVVAHRLHGDCHLGNLLLNRDSPFFVDFDDMVVGPAVQDVWLLLPGRPSEDPQARRQLEMLLEGYEEMRPFDRSQLSLIEILRALRFVHYTAWVARRWKDPAFPLAFPEFGTHRYWTDETQDLERQLIEIQKTFP